MRGGMSADDLRGRVGELEWYHTLELAPGVVTPGWFDTRDALALIPFPRDLSGARCLDVGTFDGFWAFTMEQRGSADVTAIDILDPRRWDWPANSDDEVVATIGRMKAAGAGFELAHDALGSSVVRRPLSVYDLDPGDVGEFDFVYVGSLLLHLRDPVGALMKVRSVCRGQLLLVDAVDLPLSVQFPRRPIAHLDGVGRPWWWKPNTAALARMVEAAGFAVFAKPVRFYMKPGAGQPLAPVRPRMLVNRVGREHATTVWRGDPHAAVLANPV